jgi:hypothetical protein
MRELIIVIEVGRKLGGAAVPEVPEDSPVWPTAGLELTLDGTELDAGADSLVLLAAMLVWLGVGALMLTCPRPFG